MVPKIKTVDKAWAPTFYSLSFSWHKETGGKLKGRLGCYLVSQDDYLPPIVSWPQKDKPKKNHPAQIINRLANKDGD